MNIIYDIVLNFDTRTNFLSLMFLGGPDNQFSNTSSKRLRYWYRILDGKDITEIIDKLKKDKNWNGVKYQNGKLVSSENLIIKVSNMNMEPVHNVFYSKFYFLSNLLKDINEDDIAIVEKILTRYNHERILYDMERMNSLRNDIKGELLSEFGLQKMRLFYKAISHHVKTNIWKYKSMEVL